ncbi:hypothetical protein [Vibrio chemaguriensis]
MCDCENNGMNAVEDFTVVGVKNEKSTKVNNQVEAFSGTSTPLGSDVKALGLKACVGASFENGKVCFQIPIYGKFCVTVPIPIPGDADLKACAETCGSFIPTGLKVSIYLNGSVVWSGTVWGSC